MEKLSQHIPIAKGNYLLFVVLIPLALLLSYSLNNSLWLDETLTYWLIKDKAHNVIERTLEYQGQSPLYFLLLWCIIQLAGASEIILRLPSVIGAALTCFITYKLARTVTDREGATISVIILMCLDSFVMAAVNARPYSLGVFFCTLSVYALIEWMQSGKKSWHLLYYISSAVTFYLHYLMGLVFLIHAALFLTLRTARPIEKRQLMFTFAALVVLFVPGLSHVIALAQKAPLYFFSDLPGTMELCKALFPPKLLIYLMTALIFARIYSPMTFKFRETFSSPAIKVLLIWFLLPPIFFFLYSYLNGSSLFFWRFYAWYSAPLAILTALLIRSIDQLKARALCMSIITLLVLLMPRIWFIEDWREAIQVVNKALAQSPAIPVLSYSGLVELENAEWLKDETRREYLGGPFVYYPLNAKPIIVPSGFENAEHKNYFTGIVEPALKEARQFILISQRTKQFSDKSGEGKLPDYFQDFFKKNGFTSKLLFSEGLVWVLVFERREAQSQLPISENTFRTE